MSSPDVDPIQKFNEKFRKKQTSHSQPKPKILVEERPAPFKPKFIDPNIYTDHHRTLEHHVLDCIKDFDGEMSLTALEFGLMKKAPTYLKNELTTVLRYLDNQKIIERRIDGSNQLLKYIKKKERVPEPVIKDDKVNIQTEDVKPIAKLSSKPKNESQNPDTPDVSLTDSSSLISSTQPIKDPLPLVSKEELDMLLCKRIKNNKRDWKTVTDDEIVDYISNHTVNTVDYAAHIGASYQTVYVRLNKLAAAGRICRSSRTSPWAKRFVMPNPPVLEEKEQIPAVEVLEEYEQNFYAIMNDDGTAILTGLKHHKKIRLTAEELVKIYEELTMTPIERARKIMIAQQYSLVQNHT